MSALDLATLSAECAVATRRGYGTLHDRCQQTQDIPLPHSRGILLVSRCTCPCHRFRVPASRKEEP